METIAYTIGGTTTEVSLTAFGVGETFKIEFGTHGESKCKLPLSALPPETATAIPFEAPCKVYTGRTGTGPFAGGTILFQGRRTDNSGQASSAGASQELVIEDAWYDLRFLTLQCAWQNITGYSGGTPTYGTPYTAPDCVLFQSSPNGQLQPNGSFAAYSPAPVFSHITTGQSIEEMLAFAIYFGGVNIQIGTIDPACYVPFYPVRSMRIADCIKVALRPHPDCTCEIDYTTTIPTFNIRARGSLSGVTLPYKGSSGNVTHLTSSLKPRPELVPSYVAIHIKNSTTINGNDVVSWSNDVYPGGSAVALRGLDVSVDMNGPKIAITNATLITAAFDPTSLTWWAAKVPTLKNQANGGQIPNSGTGSLALLDATVNGGLVGHLKGIQVVDDSGAAINLSTYGYELVSGTPANWMIVVGGSAAVQWIEANVIAFFSYYKETTAGATNLVDQMGEHMHSVRVKLINTASGLFTQRQTLSTGETYPAGLAQAIYGTLSILQYNFTHEILDAPFSTLIKPGKHCLNLTGGAAAWATMNAMVQAVEMELMFSKSVNAMVSRTIIHCGPVAHLEAGELIQIFNMFTNRDLSKINPTERSSGSSLGGGSASLGAETPKENSVPAVAVPALQNVAATDATSGNINVLQSDPSTGAVYLSQNDSSTGAQITEGFLAPEFNGAGAPGPTTLA